MSWLLVTPRALEATRRFLMRNKTIVTVFPSSFLLLSVVLGWFEASPALAQNGSQFKDWNPTSDEVRLKPNPSSPGKNYFEQD
jgi:hypothetical protein